MAHHIILISLDALRADRLPWPVGPRTLTPNLHRLMAESACFRRATSPATWTLPAHMSMLSGLDPLVHGCISPRRVYPPEQLPFPLIFELLSSGGYGCMARVGGGYTEARFGFGRGCEDYGVVNPLQDCLKQVAAHAGSGEKTFAFVHSFVVHDYPMLTSHPQAMVLTDRRDPSYEGCFPRDRDFLFMMRGLALSKEHPQVKERDLAFLNDLYMARVAAADEGVRALIAALREQGTWSDTTLIITADHGESLGEVHGGRRHFSHGGPPYGEQVRVPLIIRPAQALEDLLEPGPVDNWVSLMDLVPTLLDLVGVPVDLSQFDGLSLLDLCQGRVSAFETRRLFFHTCEDRGDDKLWERLFGTAMLWRDHEKLIFNPRTGEPRELYDLDRDPAETFNRLGETDPGERRRMKAAVEEYLAATRDRAHQPTALPFQDFALTRRLAALGYIEE